MVLRAHVQLPYSRNTHRIGVTMDHKKPEQDTPGLRKELADNEARIIALNQLNNLFGVAE